MRKLCLLVSLLTGLTNLYSQSASPTTIFELLGIDSTPCDISSHPHKEPRYEGLVDRSDDYAAKVPAAEMLIAAQPTIAKHFSSFRIDPNQAFRVHELRGPRSKRAGTPDTDLPLVAYLMKQGEDYTLYSRDNKLIWKKKLGYTERYHDDYEGFNAWNNTSLTTYYDINGKIISANEYEYIEHDNGDYFRVLKDNKWGLIDRSGKLIVPIQYDYIASFKSGNKQWYVIDEKGKDQYILAEDQITKIYIPHGKKTPWVLADRYWQIGKDIYDPVRLKHLFCNINQWISYIPGTQLLKINAAGSLDFYFDFEGKLLGGNPKVVELHPARDSLFIAVIAGRIDSFGLGTRRNYLKYQLVSIRGNEMHVIFTPLTNSKLEYLPGQDLFMHSGASIDSIVAITPRADTHYWGVLDSKGKYIIPPGTFMRISPTPKKGWFIGDKGAWANDKSKALQLFNITTGDTLPIDKFYEHFWPTFPGADHLIGNVIHNVSILDTNLKPIRQPVLPRFILANYEPSVGLLRTMLYKPNYTYRWKEDAAFVYYDRNFKRVAFKINDTLVNAFVMLFGMENGRYEIELPHDRRFIQLGNNKFLQTPYTDISYDPIARWYIGANKQGLKGTFDSTGAVIIPFVCRNIYRMRDSANVQIEISGSENQVINTSGRILFDLKYKLVYPIDTQHYSATLEDKKGIIHKSGGIIVPFNYSDVRIQYGKIVARPHDNAPVHTYDLKLLNPH